MIFVTVGQMLPFDRLVRAVDRWAGQHGRSDVVAQVGASRYTPEHLRWSRKLSPAVFEEHVRDASIVVAHAGMGTVMTALDLGKPLLVMPRRAALREATNDHQVATARHLAQERLATVAFDEDDLLALLDRADEIRPAHVHRTPEAESLVRAIHDFITAGGR